MKAKPSCLLNLPRWQVFLAAAWIVGILLRVTFVQDMEYKEDEEYNFNQTQWVGITQPWPWYGIASGVYLVNPGMSVWVFVILARLFGIHQPTSLAHAVQWFAILGMSLILPFVYFLKDQLTLDEQSHWLWAFALAMVNPFLILYQRKLWPEPFLPFFTMLVLMGWWKRNRWWGALLWGGIGAWLGQIHMSGFFFSAALFLWTVFFDPQRKPLSEPRSSESSTYWIFWLVGSVIGALPLIPWAVYVLKHPIQESITQGWSEIIQLKYWVFWLTDPLGLHLGGTVGVFRGPSHWDQLSDWIRYPLLGDKPTYLVGLAHAIAILVGVAIGVQALLRLFRAKQTQMGQTRGPGNTGFLIQSAFWGCGALLTATGIMIRRYYMTATFPLEFLFLTRLAAPQSNRGRRMLIALWLAELAMSAGFVYYVHVHQGSTQGDYGEAYQVHHQQEIPSP